MNSNRTAIAIKVALLLVSIAKLIVEVLALGR
jgi:hypothetical protein